eukprot:3319215-Karenia_brevis.AAC.1
MFTAIKDLKRPVFNNCGLPLRARALVLSSLLLTKGLYNCGCWPLLSAAEMQRIHMSVMRAYRCVFSDPYLSIDCKESDVDLVVRNELASP